MMNKKLLLIIAGAVLIIAVIALAMLLLYNPAASLKSPYFSSQSSVPRETIATSSAKSFQPPVSTSSLESQRNITYIASMRVAVDDVKKAVDSASNICLQLGGYVASVDFSQDTGETATVTLKIPAQTYRDAINLLSGLGRLESLQEKALDVTDQWIDLNARLTNLKAEESRLLQLLDKATNIQDVLQIEDRLANVRYQIEFYQAQLRNLERSITYSTITVTFTLKEKPLEWPSVNLIGTLRDGLATALTVLSLLIIGVIGLSPIIILGFIAWLVFKRIRKTRQPESEKQAT
ncbi:MAG: DUF4349 domain-containing protein [Infirmifilum sp.]